MNNNPLLCDTETGVCELPGGNNIQTNPTIAVKANQPVSVVYFTDPICSTCWGIEPQLRKLKLEYGHIIDIEYRMGGLLPDWSYNSGGISHPSHVAAHWDEVSLKYNMPIDGDVWLEDPLSSSYPPSIAFKAAQIQDNTKALRFLRILREMVFLEKKNITHWQHLEEAAANAGLDTRKFKQDYEDEGVQYFNADLELAKARGVRGFPSIFITNNYSGVSELVYGFKPYAVYEKVIEQIYPDAAKRAYNTDWQQLFAIYPTLTTTEFSILSNWPFAESATFLESLVSQQLLSKLITKNGVLWCA